ncbi:MAG: HAD family hydrolase [Euryarchaeota archaeon]|nr:HAD family hydrolase [Euryarchaeota archaeon]
MQGVDAPDFSPGSSGRAQGGRKAVFVDRDGTLNVNIDYLSDPAGYRLYPGAAEGLRLLRERGFLIIVVTNQSGIGRGLFDERALGRVHDKMRADLANGGASIDGLYFCPHRPDEGCDCRKPKTAMFERAIRDHGIDPARSFVIGDMGMDVEAGKRIGARTALVPEPKNREKTLADMGRWPFRPDFVGEDFLSAVRWILGQD